MLRPRLVGLAIAVFVASALQAQMPPLGQNLLVNGDFESNLTGWAISPAGSALARTYGTATNIPLTLVAQAIGGGSTCVGDAGTGGGNGVSRLRQSFDISGHSALVDGNQLAIRLSAFLGGFLTDTDSAALVVQFLDANGLPVGLPPSTRTIGPVAPAHRNQETVLLRREEVFPIPPQTRMLNIDIQLTHGGGSADGCADNVSAKLEMQTPHALLPLNTELLSNTGFQSGWDAGFGGSSPLTLQNAGGFNPTGWTGIGNQPMSVQFYGTTAFSVPAPTVAQVIGGGDRLCVDITGSIPALEQEFDLSGNASQIAAQQLYVQLSGFFGAASPSGLCGLRAWFYSLSPTFQYISQGSTALVGAPTNAKRHGEPVLLRDRNTFLIPPSTTRMFVRLEFSGGGGGCADNLSAKLVTNPYPPALPIGAELLVNGGFENGWTPTSVLTLRNPNAATSDQNWTGWYGTGNVAGQSQGYGSFAGGLAVPAFTVSQAIGGQSRVCIDGGNNASLEQTLDLHGNITQLAGNQLAIRISGYFGAVTGASSRYGLRMTQYSDFGMLQADPAIGNPTPTERNQESVLLKYSRTISLLPQTTRVVFDLDINTSGFSGVTWVDNLSAVLVAQNPPPPLPLNAELLSNGTFENGWTPASPLQLQNPTGFNDTGWVGASGTTSVDLYGAPGAPSSPVPGGGSRVLGDASNGAVKQTFDLTGNLTQVQQGILSLHLSGFLGGQMGNPDTARITASFLNGIIQLPQSLTLGPQSGPMVLRQGDIVVPQSATQLVVQVAFVNSSGSQLGVADNVSAALFNTLSGTPLLRPGTNEDLYLFSGINSATPSTGPSNEIKTARTGDILTLVIDSFAGTFDNAYPILAVETMPTPTSVTPCGAACPLGFQLHPTQILLLYNGLAAPPPFGPQPLYATNQFVFVLPAGFIGQSLLFQAGVIPLQAPFPMNGQYATTGAHEIRIIP